ncbi:hypothetical protein T06_1109 [Trichinella sp. T6]|nr:hypothetical protein T06_1109 [Trichinella sp. T6]
MNKPYWLPHKTTPSTILFLDTVIQIFNEGHIQGRNYKMQNKLFTTSIFIALNMKLYCSKLFGSNQVALYLNSDCATLR